MSLSELADVLNSASGDIHFIHFYAGADGNWDRIHEIAAGYYYTLGEDYDAVVELSLQMGEDVGHPNDSATRIGFVNSDGSLVRTFSYDDAMRVMHEHFGEAIECAQNCLNRYEDVGVQNYLEDLIMRYTKERNYKLARRIGHANAEQALAGIAKANRSNR